MATNPLSARELQILRDRISSRHPELSSSGGSNTSNSSSIVSPGFCTDAELDAAADAFLGMTGSFRVRLGPDILQAYYQRLGLEYSLEDCAKMLSLFINDTTPAEGSGKAQSLTLDEFVYGFIRNSRVHKLSDVARTLLDTMEIKTDGSAGSTKEPADRERRLVNAIIGPTSATSRIGDAHGDLLMPAIRKAVAGGST